MTAAWQALPELLVQVVMAGVGTLCFAVLFCVPKQQYVACAVDGAVGWAVYSVMMLVQPSTVMATLVAVIPLTLLARIFAVVRKAPVTVFLLCGIFPLVPGAGIYYTAYYFIRGDTELFGIKGTETLKIAMALALGISLVLGIPLPRFGRRKDGSAQSDT